MVLITKGSPFFLQIENDIKFINDQPEEAVKALIARKPILFQKSLFRAFLHLTKEECDNMGADEYLDNLIMLKKVLELIHDHYLDHNQ